MLTGRIVPVVPDPAALAAGLSRRGHRHVALLHAASASPCGWSRWSYVAADPDLESAEIDPFEGPLSGEDPPSFAAVPRWIGVLPYEAFRHLERPSWRPVDTRPAPRIERPRWLRYPAVLCVDHLEGTVIAVGERSAAEGLAAAARRVGSFRAEPPARLTIEAGEPLSRHAERIAVARELIVAGDLYQVNLARRERVTLGGGTVHGLYGALIRAAPTPFAACLDLGDTTVISTSPELLLAAEARPGGKFGAIATEPIKGTRPRGAHAVSDAALAAELDLDPKERAELSMIVDVERNDLGRVARIGSVKVTVPPRVVTHRTVHHRVARVTAVAREGAGRVDVLRAVVPSGSVTGAPKVRAMEVIASLEEARRGLYTGGLGFVRRNGGVVLAMAIRTLVLGGDEGEYWTGGGIVADSDPALEVEETRWKALQLLRAASRPSGET